MSLIISIKLDVSSEKGTLEGTNGKILRIVPFIIYVPRGQRFLSQNGRIIILYEELKRMICLPY